MLFRSLVGIFICATFISLPAFAASSPSYLSASNSQIYVNNSVLLSWGAPRSSSGTVRYNFDVKKPGDSWYRRLSGTTSRSFNRYIGKTGTHEFRVNACDNNGCGSYAYTSVRVTNPPPPPPPAPSKPSSISVSNHYVPVNSAFSISWGYASGVTRYQVYENDGSQIYSGSSRSMNRSHSSYGRRSYKVRACNDGGCSGFTSKVYVVVYTAPGSVNNLSVSSSSVSLGSTATFSWDSAGGEVPGHFYKYVITRPDGTISHGQTSGNSYTASFSQPGNHNFSVTACNPNNVGCGSNRTASVNVLAPAPTGIPNLSSPGYAPINNSYSLSWSSVSNATVYELVEDGSTIYSGGSTSASISRSSYGHRYYKVRACNSYGNCASYSSQQPVYVYTAPGGVQNLIASAATVNENGVVNISWGAAGGSVPGVSHSVHVQSSAGTQTYSTTGNAMDVVLSNPGNNQISVVACNPSGVGCGGTRTVNVSVLANPPSGIPNLSMDSYAPVDKSLSISWGSVSGATEYKLLEDGNVIYSGTATSTTTTKATYGHRYYKVQACRFGACSSPSSERPVFFYTAPGSVNNLASSSAQVAVDGKVTISWNEPGGIVPGATYTFVKESPDGTSVSENTTALSREVTLTQAGNYTFKVGACNPENVGCGATQSISVDAALTKPSSPGVPSGYALYVPVNKDNTFSWSATHSEETVTDWVLYESTSETEPGSEIFRGKVSQNYTVNRDSYGHRYYRVKACNQTVCSDEYSIAHKVFVYTAPGAVNNLASSSSQETVGGKITISWNEPGGFVPGVTYTFVTESPDGTSVSESTTALSREVSLSQAGNYNFKVIACNPENVGCGATKSVSVAAVLAKPSSPGVPSGYALYVPVNKDNTFGWSATNSEETVTDWVLYESTSETEPGSEIFRGKVSENYTVNRDSYGHRYYRVKACNQTVCSDEYSIAHKVFVYTAPGGVNDLASSVDEEQSSATLSWQKPGGIVPQATYHLNITNPAGELTQVETQDLNYQLSLPQNGSYTVSVVACNPQEVGCGSAREIVISNQNQSITLTDLTLEMPNYRVGEQAVLSFNYTGASKCHNKGNGNIYFEGEVSSSTHSRTIFIKKKGEHRITVRCVGATEDVSIEEFVDFTVSGLPAPQDVTIKQ